MLVIAVMLGWNPRPAMGGALAAAPVFTTPVLDSQNAGRCVLRDGVFRNGSRAANKIALTFDACPTSHKPAFAADVVQFLETMQVPATFFVSGEWADANPEALARLNGQPFFQIALHGFHHPHLTDATPEQIRAEIEDGRAALLRHGIRPAPFFRAPYGDNPPDLASVARQSSVLAVMGDGGLGDPDPNRTAPVMERDAIRWLQAGSVIILHINGRGYATADTVAHLVPLLRARGYEFVRISDLAGSCDPTE
ncbi:MAG: polysaccharide deacetylase family protein [Alphaproteobacteria bacterium]|nr:polysaccharide deacetylase family protein [Alphaproteobacteria bacterium]